jgi:hypothetical protein
MNKGLVKLKAIVARAKKIREAAGSTTKTVKVVKYKMMQKDAVKKAAAELRKSGQKSRRKTSATRKSKRPTQMKLF